MSDEPNKDSRDERYRRQTDANYAALGRYVQEYEELVSVVRRGCSDLIGDSKGMLQIVLNHPALTAMPLFQIYRASLSEWVKRLGPRISESDRVLVGALSRYLASSIQEVSNRRNILLHGQWMIGYGSPEQDDFTEIHAWKAKYDSTGYSQQRIVEHADEINDARDECAALRVLTAKLNGCMSLILADPLAESLISSNIFVKDKVWSVSLPSHSYRRPKPPTSL